jgi:hypothetical protein
MKYVYQGPVDSSVTLKVEGKERDVVLFRGKEVDLPEGHDYTQTLKALGYLKPVVSKAAAVEVVEPELIKKGAK